MVFSHTFLVWSRSQHGFIYASLYLHCVSDLQSCTFCIVGQASCICRQFLLIVLPFSNVTLYDLGCLFVLITIVFFSAGARFMIYRSHILVCVQNRQVSCTTVIIALLFCLTCLQSSTDLIFLILGAPDLYWEIPFYCSVIESSSAGLGSWQSIGVVLRHI